MKLSENLNRLLNQQIMHELRNSNIYAQMQCLFEDLQLNNIAKYLKEQSEHERGHAQKFIDHINARTGGKVRLTSVESPNVEVDFNGEFDLNKLIQLALLFVETEEKTTEKIENIYAVAFAEQSYIDLGLIQEMLNEQVEEEDSANKFLVNAKLVKDIVLWDSTFAD